MLLQCVCIFIMADLFSFFVAEYMKVNDIILFFIKDQSSRPIGGQMANKLSQHPGTERLSCGTLKMPELCTHWKVMLPIIFVTVFFYTACFGHC